MWFVRKGNWEGQARFTFEVVEGKPVSLDRKLRETLAGAAPRRLAARERQERLALVARWYYSTWREGEWIALDGPEPPYRKLINAINRVARRQVY
jgi:hypothetical protein